MNTPAPTTSEFTILLVDDRPENLLALQDLLDMPHRRFIQAQSGSEALKIILSHNDIGLIMLDVQMPDMDGFEVAQMLQSNPRTSNISIIFVTAISKEEQFVMQGFREGAVDYLPKPLDTNLVQAKVKVFEKLYFYQKQLRETAAELERINKQLERFNYIVAHDLKSPLSGIITLLSVLETDPVIRGNPHTATYMDLVQKSSHHLSDMISELLSYSRRSQSEQNREQVDVRELAQQIFERLIPADNVELHFNDPLPVLQTQRMKLQQVFQNLLSNAIKYNDKPITRIEVGCLEKAEFYEFYVRDNGPGIESEDEERIFRLFQTSGRSSRGDSSTGVGLNLLKVLVEEQGGRLWVDSSPATGSCFYFEWKK
jgi:signal transduction histidine kinase